MEQPTIHICGKCTKQFDSEEAYIVHPCSDGYTPADPGHQGTEFLEIQKAALERAKEREDVDNDKQDIAIAALDEKIKEVNSETVPVVEVSPVEQTPPMYQPS